jgi:hypothetical protein
MKDIHDSAGGNIQMVEYLPISELNLHYCQKRENSQISFKLYFYEHIIVVLGVHCDIYKSSYHIS